jgi:TolA-binding protein
MTDDSKRNTGPPDTGKQGDDGLDEYLAGSSRLSRNYRAVGDEEPSPEIDARILAEAERAARVVSLPVQNKRARWTVPLAVAATVMVSFSLVMSIVSDVESPLPTGRNQSMDVAERRALVDEEQAFAAAESIPADPAEVTLADMPGRTDEATGKLMTARRNERLARDVLEEEMIYPMAMAPAAGSRAVASPIPAGELDKRINVIRAYLNAGYSPQNSGAMEIGNEAKKSETDLSTALRANRAPMKDQNTVEERQLEEVLRLYEADQLDAAQAAISDFIRRYPEHPVSIQFSDREF